MFVIEDDFHAEAQEGRFDSREEALTELTRRAELRWDEPPNQCPCMSSKSCRRDYVIVEIDTNGGGWIERSRENALVVAATGSRWLIPR